MFHNKLIPSRSLRSWGEGIFLCLLLVPCSAAFAQDQSLRINNIIADKYEALGLDKVDTFFPGDYTYTNKEGEMLNTEIVINGIKNLKH